jgi:inhibitor of KinA sporulation pathway (predicted exonuclease)
LLINLNRTVRVVAEQTTREIPRHSYGDQLTQFNSACEWLSLLGVIVSPTRIGNYRRILADIEAKHREGKIDELLKRYGFPALANALFESTELIDIHEGLSGMDERIAQSLQKFAVGCPLLTDECRTGNNIGRNIGFELDTAALFRRCGFPIKLQPPADVWIETGNTDVAVECKRPFSYDALGANIEKAFSQLRKRYRDHARALQVRGIAALSASKMENDGSLMLKAQDTADLNATIRRLSDQFVARTEEFWNKTGDERTIGLVVSLRAPSHVEDINLFTVVRHLTWIGLARTAEDQKLFRRVANAHMNLRANAKADPRL